MVAAATRARHFKDRNDYENKEFRTFLFIFANAFFHETCHLFTTYLTQGRHDGCSKMDRGEFGRYMETVVFGGTLEYYRDPTHGVGQVRLHKNPWQNSATSQVLANRVL